MSAKSKHAQKWAQQKRQVMAFINLNGVKKLPEQTNGHRYGVTELQDRDLYRALSQSSVSRG